MKTEVYGEAWLLSDAYKFETSKDEEDTLYVAVVNWTASQSQQVECHLYSENRAKYEKYFS
jgi:hypothetical protein